jgi:hypothetical protein
LLGRVRVANKFPDVNARMQPSARNLRFRCACQAKLGRDFLAFLSHDFGSPRRRPTSMQELVLNQPHVLLQTRDASETGHRLSAIPDFFEQRQGPPGLLGRPLPACRGATPRRIRPLLDPTSLREDLRRDHHRLHVKQNARHPVNHSFRGHITTAHMLACLRFAGLVTETVARLTTGSGGLTPGRAGSAPAGRQTKFHGVITFPPIPIDQQSLVALNVLSPQPPLSTSPKNR